MTATAAIPVLDDRMPFLGVTHSVTGKVWRDRLDARATSRALAMVQRYQLPEMLARVLAGRGVELDAKASSIRPFAR